MEEITVSMHSSSSSVKTCQSYLQDSDVFDTINTQLTFSVKPGESLEVCDPCNKLKIASGSVKICRHINDTIDILPDESSCAS